MVDITSIVIGLTNTRVKELAEEMRDEMKAIVAGHIKTGAAYNSIEIKWNQGGGTTGVGGSLRGGFMTSVFIGSDEKSAYFLDEGNGGRGAVITSTREFDRRGRRPGKLGYPPNGIPGYGFRASVRGYEGIHFAREVADRHR